MTSYLERMAASRFVQRFGIPLLIVAAVLITFRGVLGHDFVAWDDRTNIVQNPHIASFTWETVRWLFTDTTYAPRYMPVGWLCYAAGRELFGLDPRLWHGANVVFHATNAVLLFLLLRKVLSVASDPVAVEGRASTIHNGCAGMAALLWALNPLRVEVVAWSSCCIYNVAFGFAMLWLLAWLHGRTMKAGPAQRTLAWLSLLSFTACLLTYPIAVFAPALLFLLDMYPLRRLEGASNMWSRTAWVPLIREKVPFLAASLATLAATAFARVGGGRMSPVSWEDFGLTGRLIQASYSLAYYAWKPFFPTELSASYPALHAFNPLGLKFVLSVLAVVIGTALALGFSRRKPVVPCLWFCHVAILFPVLGLSEYPHSTYDRYSHLHSTIIAGLLAVWFLAAWKRQKAVFGILVAGVSCVLIGSAVASTHQVPAWKDTFSLYTQITTRYGNHPSRNRFDEVLADEYFAIGRTNEAVASLKRAAYYDIMRKDRHIYDEGVASRCETRLAKLEAENGDLNAAADHYVAAVNAESVTFFAVPRTIEAAALLIKLDRAAEALPLLRKALHTAPGNAALHRHLGAALEQLGEHAEAHSHFEEERRLRVTAQQRNS